MLRILIIKGGVEEIKRMTKIEIKQESSVRGSKAGRKYFENESWVKTANILSKVGILSIKEYITFRVF